MKLAKDYRRDAREVLDHKIFGNKWLYALLVCLVASAILSFVSAITYPISPIVGGIVGTIIVVLVSGPISYGLISVFLRLVRKEDDKADLMHLFDGFKEKLSESFVTQLLMELYVFLWSLLLLIPGIIKSYSYAAAMYLVREKGLTGNEAITESRRIMNGNKWRAFCLDLSFIGWYIVGMLCLGVGVLWVLPYHEAAKAQFFDELVGAPVVVEAKPIE